MHDASALGGGVRHWKEDGVENGERRVLVRRVLRGVTFSDPSVAKDFLRLKPPGAVDVRALSNPQH